MKKYIEEDTKMKKRGRGFLIAGYIVIGFSILSFIPLLLVYLGMMQPISNQGKIFVLLAFAGITLIWRGKSLQKDTNIYR
jgi:hypothetical protein